MSKQHRQKLVGLLQAGLQRKDMSVINQAMELDNSLGDILTLQDFEAAFRNYIVEKTIQEWMKAVKEWISMLGDDLEYVVKDALKAYRKSGLAEDLEISEWVCDEAKSFDKHNKDWIPYIDSADDYRWYIKNELKF